MIYWLTIFFKHFFMGPFPRFISTFIPSYRKQDFFSLLLSNTRSPRLLFSTLILIYPLQIYMYVYITLWNIDINQLKFNQLNFFFRKKNQHNVSHGHSDEDHYNHDHFSHHHQHWLYENFSGAVEAPRSRTYYILGF